MVYTGNENSTGYVISATGSLSDSIGDLNVVSMYSVILNPLTTRRKNGKTWLNNLTYVLSFGEETEHLIGDINADGKINARDAKMALQHFTGKIKLTDEQKERADVNKDGKINARDAKLILQYFTGKIKEL